MQHVSFHDAPPASRRLLDAVDDVSAIGAESSPSTSGVVSADQRNGSTAATPQPQSQDGNDMPPPLLPACIATSLMRSHGYTCRGALPLGPAMQVAPSVFSPGGGGGGGGGGGSDRRGSGLPGHDGIPINSVAELLAVQEKGDHLLLPPWAVSILQQCAVNAK